MTFTYTATNPASTSRAAHFICLLDELGLGPDALQVLTHWMCHL
jgi:hypothetical protein